MNDTTGRVRLAGLAGAIWGTTLLLTGPRIWVALTGGLSGAEVMPFAQARGVIYVDGSAFFVDGSGQEFMRLSFSAPSPERIDEGVSRLAAAISDARLQQVGPTPSGSSSHLATS